MTEAQRHGARVCGCLVLAGAVAMALVGGIPTGPLEVIGFALFVCFGLSFLLGGFYDSVSIGPVTVPWYGLVGAGFVGIGVYILAGVVVSTGGGILFGIVLPTGAGLCSCWIGVQYARRSEHVGLAPETP